MVNAMGGAMRLARTHRESWPAARNRARDSAYAPGTPSSMARTVDVTLTAALLVNERRKVESQSAR